MEEQVIRVRIELHPFGGQPMRELARIDIASIGPVRHQPELFQLTNYHCRLSGELGRDDPGVQHERPNGALKLVALALAKLAERVTPPLAARSGDPTK